MSEHNRHRAFSPRRLAAISANTLTELARLRLFHVLLLFALVLIGSSAFLARLSFQQEVLVLKDVSLGAMSLFTTLLAILVSARLLPQDQADRTVYTILARPVPRFEYVLGKFAGVVLLLGLSVMVMSVIFVAVLFLRQHAPSAPVLDLNLLPALAVIFIKACLLAALTLFISTFATTNIFTVVVTAMVYFIGHIQATAREFWMQEQGAGWLGRFFLATIALFFPDLQLFDFSDEIVTGLAVPMSLVRQTFALGTFYILVYLLLAIAIFNAKEL